MPSQAAVPGAPPEPPADAPLPVRAGWLLRVQARACAVMGSPLYGELLQRAAADAEARGPVWAVLAGHLDVEAGDRRTSALALRLMAAVHRMTLSGEAPQLARHYPSTGGDGDPDGAWAAFHGLLGAQGERIADLVVLPCQTNEVGRAAGLTAGFLTLAARFGFPLRLLEVGASAGLNLRWDRFRYAGGGASWGDGDSPVDLTGMWAEPPPTDVRVEIAERAGCDRNPVDPTTPEGTLVLRSSLWADQGERFARLDGAIELAGRIPATVEQASADRWVAERLAEPVPGTLTVVYHSVVEEYLPGAVRSRFHAAVRSAGARATAEGPLAWVRLEPISELRRHGVTVTVWPGGEEAVVATCGAHGHDTRYRTYISGAATAPARP